MFQMFCLSSSVRKDDGFASGFAVGAGGMACTVVWAVTGALLLCFLIWGRKGSGFEREDGAANKMNIKPPRTRMMIADFRPIVLTRLSPMSPATSH